jgi:hypothetical protein
MWLMKPMLYLSTAKAHTRQSMTISFSQYRVYQVLIYRSSALPEYIIAMRLAFSLDFLTFVTDKSRNKSN